MKGNLQIDEQTAVAMTILINNHIEAMKVWQRKLKDPFVPKPNVVFHPAYPKPTIATMLHISNAGAHFANEVAQLTTHCIERVKRGNGI